jgi:phosphonate transport system substrate-binding protein
MFKKSLVAGMAFAVAATILVGCGSSDEKNTGSENEAAKTEANPEKLIVGFIPSQNAETLSAKAKPMGDLLSKELGIPVEVTVTTNYTGLIEAMAAKKIDVGFLSPVDYVHAHDKKQAVKLLLQTERDGKNYYRSQFVKLKTNTAITKLEDIKGKKVAFVSATSAAGYTYPGSLLKSKGIDPQTDVQGVMAGGHDKGLQALLRGDVDIATTFEDARTTMVKTVPDIMEKTEVVAYTENIPNDTVSIRNGFSDEFNKKVADAFMKIMSTEEGKKIGKEIYSFDNLVPGDDKNFDTVRETQDQHCNQQDRRRKRQENCLRFRYFRCWLHVPRRSLEVQGHRPTSGRSRRNVRWS